MLSVENGDWDQLQQDARLIRELVFIVEQNIPEQDEWDDQDAISQHFVVYDRDQPVATARPFLKLSSQVHAVSFYEKLGFVTQGDPYDECGIPHIEMIMPLIP